MAEKPMHLLSRVPGEGIRPKTRYGPFCNNVTKSKQSEPTTKDVLAVTCPQCLISDIRIERLEILVAQLMR